MNDEERNKLIEAVQTLRDFINGCRRCYASCLITQDNTELRTDWGYVGEGLDLIEEYAKR